MFIVLLAFLFISTASAQTAPTIRPRPTATCPPCPCTPTPTSTVAPTPTATATATATATGTVAPSPTPTATQIPPTPTATPSVSPYPTPTPVGNVCQSDGTSSSVQACVNTSQPGDTVTLPSGTFPWSVSVNIAKSLTIQGNGTVITDNIVKTGGNLGAFKVSGIPASDTGLIRITGISFQGGNTSDYQGSGGEVNIDRISAYPNIRVDNCVFNALHMRPIWLSGSPLGVIDHSTFTMTNWVGGITVGHGNWRGIGDSGDNSWADDSHFGTDQFVFIEDNTFNNFSAATFIDSESGMRVVVRYNTVNASEAGNHGTETGQRHRGGRVFEFYQNHCDGGALIHTWNLYIRSGACLVWGNYSDRYDSLVVFSEYRLWFPATPWGQADGTNAWDVNDPQVYLTGTATGGATNTMQDTTRSWATNQWRGFILRNTATGKASQIDSNTATSIHFDSNPQGTTMSFVPGNSYDIRKVIHVLDQPGYGKGDLINVAAPAWPNELSEPVRIWSNTLGPNFGNGNGRPVVYTQGLNVLANQDWFYSTDASAALPGYVPFTYPHPLQNNGENVNHLSPRRDQNRTVASTSRKTRRR